MIDNEITLDADWLLDSCLVWAMRYCAGRRTYASSDVVDMAMLIHENRLKFKPNKVELIIRDLREVINMNIDYIHNVEVEYSLYSRFDAYQLIAKDLARHPKIKFWEYDWYVNCNTAGIERTKIENPVDITRLYDCDLDSVVKAIAILDTDKHYRVTTDYNGNIAERDCFMVYDATMLDRDGIEKWEKQYHPISNPRVSTVGEYITKVKKI